MKIKIFYILSLLFIFSCDAFDEIISELDESEAELEYSYYIQEGWEAIESENFLAALNFFDYIINAYQSLGDASDITEDIIFEAYHGFAWSNLFIANTLYGIENSDQRLVYRDISYDAFFISESILDSIDFSSSAYSFDYDCDILAGKTLHHDYKIYYYLNQYFAYDGDSEYLDDISLYSDGEEFTDSNNNGQYDDGEDFIDLNSNSHLELGLENLVNQMNINCSDYIFPYSNIDINNINMMLIKDYIRKGMYQETVDFIESISLPSINLEFNIQMLDQEVSSEMYLIGDFLNKTIDFNDLYDINLDTQSVSIEVTPYLPCNFYNLETNQQLTGDELRDELLDCVDNYFETSSEIVFRYKYVNGSYTENIYNQETNLSSCSNSDGYRTLTIDLDSLDASIITNDCYNSCSSSCFDN